MHVGFLTLESPFETAKGGGIASYLRALIPALVHAGHRVTVITNTPEAEDRPPQDGAVRVVNVRLPGLHWYLAKLPWLGDALSLPVRHVEWSLAFSRAAARVAATDPLDVLESTELGALFLARRPVAPLVVRLHGSDYVFRKFTGQPLHRGARWGHHLEQAVRRQAAAITSPSRFHAEEVGAGLGWSPGRIEVIPNPIAPDVLAEGLYAGENLRENRDGPLVLYTGRMAVVKGTVPLIEAARLVRTRHPAARFVFAGPWQMAEKPEHWALTKGADAAGVQWLGHVPWRGLSELYRRADVFVMPSLYETFCISCLEAMAFGLPVVATRAGGLPEVVEDGVTGMLVPPGDPRALADAIESLWRNPDLRRKMGEAGRERVLAHFTANHVAQETLRVYERFRRAIPAA
jgi:glycosyltransferase involved in cell wall biosynthesis